MDVGARDGILGSLLNRTDPQKGLIAGLERACNGSERTLTIIDPAGAGCLEASTVRSHGA